MGINRRARRAVLKDKSGLSTSIADALGGVSLSAITMVMVGALLTTLLVFWVVLTASADTSGGYQAANVGFEKAVKSSNVLVGVDDKRVGILKDVPGSKCEVQTWQSGSRDGGTTLQIDTKTVAGVCTPTTPLVAAGAGTTGQELLFGIEAPVFTYSNLGGREITFNASGTPTLTTGTKPAAVKTADWDDVRPYKAELKLQTLDKDTDVVAKKAVLTAYTNVMNVTAAADDLRYVPSPSDAAIPGPVRITGVARSTTTGTAYAGAREGAAITFAGAVCPAGPTKVNISYTQQGPAAAPAVNTVYNAVLTGADTTVHLASVPNGSSGAVDVSATCVDGGVAEKTASGYTQAVPPTVLTAKQNETIDRHDLSWIPVSSLPTSFELRRTVGTKAEEALVTTDKLVYAAPYTKGSNLGLTSLYSIVATVDSNKSPAATASVTNPLPQAPAPVVSSNIGGATWPAITCTEGATPEYQTRYYQQTGYDAAVNWTPLTAWSTTRSLTGVTTPAFGRTVAQVHTRCVATVSGAVSPTNNSYDVFYVPEAIQVAASRSSAVGTEYMGAREGLTAWHAGARCYNGVPTRMVLTWVPKAPAGQSNVVNSRGFVPTGGSQSVDLAGVYNGASGELWGTATCADVKTGYSEAGVGYTQPLPVPGLTVVQQTPEWHKLTWNRVSTLPTTFRVEWGSSNSLGGVATTTTALTYTHTQAAGSTYGMTSDYTVRPTVGNQTSSSYASTFTNWPAPPTATGITYTHTGAGGYTNGNITWNYSGATCPAGTTLRSRQVPNAAGQSNGTLAWGEFVVGPWVNGMYGEGNRLSMQQGYAYAVRIDAQCVSNITGSVSPASFAQGGTFVTPMAQPAGPGWDMYNYREWIRGSGWSYHTNPGVASMKVDWVTACSPGSWMGWSNWTSQSWTGAQFNHPIGSEDYWTLPAGWGSAVVYYMRAEYSCNTPWATSPRSPQSGTAGVTITR